MTDTAEEPMMVPNPHLAALRCARTAAQSPAAEQDAWQTHWHNLMGY